jgi:DNA-binding LacI/PurR family transcriptional regulator
MQAEKLCSPHDRTLERRIREKLLKNSSGEIFRVNLHNALDRLFEKERFTAIVGGGVSTPVFILEYLDLKKIAVPAQMSLAGFGNSLAESENGITSFDCDCYSVAHAVVWHLLRPEQKKRTANNRYTVIEGVLMPRMSTSRAGDGSRAGF